MPADFEGLAAFRGMKVRSARHTTTHLQPGVEVVFHGGVYCRQLCSKFHAAVPALPGCLQKAPLVCVSAGSGMEFPH